MFVCTVKRKTVDSIADQHHPLLLVAPRDGDGETVQRDVLRDRRHFAQLEMEEPSANLADFQIGDAVPPRAHPPRSATVLRGADGDHVVFGSQHSRHPFQDSEMPA
jgi:hypothetical protein